LYLKRLAALVAIVAVGLSTAACEPSRVAPAMMQFTQQQTTATPADSPVLLDSKSVFQITDAISYTTPTLDVRPYNSFFMFIRAEDGTYLDTDTLEVDLNFYTTPAGVPGAAGRSYHDKYIIFKTNILGSTRFELTDLMHGPYMRMTVFNDQGVARNFNLTFELWGSYRDLPATWLRTTADGVIHEGREVLGAGAAVTRRVKLGYGRAKASLLSGAGGGATMAIRYGASTMNDVLVVAAANTRVTQEIVMPRWQPQVTITNNGGAGSTIDWHIIQQGYPQ
jgi:hypothetical protein